MSKKYNVHAYAVVRVPIKDVEAGSQKEAIDKVADETDFYALLGRGDMEFAEDFDSFLVDEVGDEEYKKSRWYDKHGELLSTRGYFGGTAPRKKKSSPGTSIRGLK